MAHKNVDPYNDVMSADDNIPITDYPVTARQVA